ncbi:MAG: hypothetical protein IJD58_10095 [Lachnospiraceae bacterium]|nr:hypothetical protein [Lachnospiraceae bacterium]
MKKRLVILLTAASMIFATACGNDDAKKTSKKTTSNVAENNNSDSNSDQSKDNNSKPTEEPATKEPVVEILPTLEKDAYVDFSGIKVPVTITWEDFQKFVTDNNWKIVSDKDDAPSDANFHGDVEVETNCGVVQFNFMPDAYDTYSVLEGVNIDYDILTDKVSICGVSCTSKLADLDKALKAELSDSETSKSYHIDDYLTVRMINRDDDKFDMSISRYPWARRKVDILEYLEHINADTELGEKIVVETKENTNTRRDMYGRLTIALPENVIYKSTDIATDQFTYKDGNDKTNYIGLGYNCNYVKGNRTCSEIEFSQELKKSIDIWNSVNTLPARISEIQIGEYSGYELYKPSPSDSRSNVRTYLMWIEGYQIEFYISYYNDVNQELYNEALDVLMQAIASVEKVQ